MNPNKILTWIFFLALLLFAGCASNEPQEGAQTSTTASTIEAVTTTMEPVTTSTAITATTTSSSSTSASSTSSTTTTKPLPRIPANTTESECYAQGFYWCAGKCSRTECAECRNYLRCVTVDESGVNVSKVETATEPKGHEGSCKYAGQYSNAGGIGSYCDVHEGDRLYGKCGVDRPDPLDCRRVLGGNQTNYVPFNSRSFHSSLGAEYDLWCFRCDKVGY